MSAPSNYSMIIDAAKREIVMTRVFDAPRELVYRAYTDPALIPQWWGPRSVATTVNKMDGKPGGVWRFVQHEASGTEYAFHGEYRELLPPERLAYTFEFEGMPGHVLLETVTFEDQDGRTKVTVRSAFDTVEGLQGMIQSGMEEGAAESHDRLAELLQSMLDNR